MILADKIIEERKRIGLSQEELAEKLDVSRQSVSKWEGAQSIPDINRILRMAEIFEVSTDYLLKEEAVRSERDCGMKENAESARALRKVSMGEAAEFVRLRKEQAPSFALGVSLCIWFSILLILLGALQESGKIGLSENAAGGIGVIVLLLMIAIAVAIFIKSDHKLKDYEYLGKAEIETAYGVDGMAKEKRAAQDATYHRSITIGVILCVLCPVPLFVALLITEAGYVLGAAVGLLLFLVGIAANLFVRAAMVKESYDILLQEGDYTVSRKKIAPILGRIATIYWLSTVAIYLAVSLPTEKWHITWVIWPVAGVLYAVVITVAKLMMKVEE